MQIRKLNLILSDNYTNILTKNFICDYQDLNNLSIPKATVQVMNNVFQLSEQAEEYVYLIAMTAKCLPNSFFEVSHETCTASLVGTREIYIRALLWGCKSNYHSQSPERSGVAI